MKLLLKTQTKLSLPIKLAIAMVYLIGMVSFFYSVKYAGDQNIAEELIMDNSLLPPQSLSVRGFQKSSFYVSLFSSENLKIYFTRDGSEPSLNSELYSTEILITDRTTEENSLANIPTSPRWKPPIGNIFKGTVIRAIAVGPNNKRSPEFTRTFFVREKKYSLPVISVTVNADDFFGYKKGIYVMGKNYEDKRDYIKKKLPLNLNWWEYPSNYLKRGVNSERLAHIEFYDTNNQLGFEDNVGVRINGNATRGFSQKSLRICYNKKYGKEQLIFKLFPDQDITQFNSFILRNSGNDWNKTMFRDAFMQSLMKDFLDIQAYRPSVLFINGEYWGIHNIRERADENYLANKYQLSKDSIIILEFGGDLFYGKKGDKEEFSELLTFIKMHNMAETANYRYIEQKIDINSFMDFIIANVYFCNSDWPNNNVKYWRYRTVMNSDSLGVKDGRWRWILYDTDWGFGYTGRDAVRLNLLEKARRNGTVGVVFNGLLKNEEFKQRFNDRFIFLMKTTFETNNVIKKIDRFSEDLAPEMNEHINRWREIGSYENWEVYVHELRTFATERPSIQRNQLKAFLNKN